MRITAEEAKNLAISEIASQTKEENIEIVQAFRNNSDTNWLIHFAMPYKNNEIEVFAKVADDTDEAMFYKFEMHLVRIKSLSNFIKDEKLKIDKMA